MKNTTLPLQLMSFVIFFLISCSKKSGEEENSVLEITPELLVSIAGKNWNTISGGFEKKKDYWYTTINRGTTLAAISLPAKDINAPVLDYKLTLNLDQQNKVSVIMLQSIDTPTVENGNKVFLYYYDRAFSKLNGVYQKFASYDNSPPPSVPVEELLGKLRTNSCRRASLSFYCPTAYLSATYTVNHSFSFHVNPF